MNQEYKYSNRVSSHELYVNKCHMTCPIYMYSMFRLPVSNICTGRKCPTLNFKGQLLPWVLDQICFVIFNGLKKSEDVYVYCTEHKYSSRCTLNLFTHNVQCVSTVPRRNAPVDRKQNYIKNTYFNTHVCSDAG